MLTSTNGNRSTKNSTFSQDLHRKRTPACGCKVFCYQHVGKIIHSNERFDLILYSAYNSPGFISFIIAEDVMVRARRTTAANLLPFPGFELENEIAETEMS